MASRKVTSSLAFRVRRVFSLLGLPPPLTNDDEWRPLGGMRIGDRALAQKFAHRHSQRLGSADRRPGRNLSKRTRSEFDGSLGVHLPVGDQQGPRARVEERTGQARQCFRSRPAGSGGVARGEHDPIGIELERGDFGRGKVAIILVGLALHWRLTAAASGSTPAQRCRALGPQARHGWRNAKWRIRQARPLPTVPSAFAR